MSSFEFEKREKEEDDVCCYFCIPMKLGIKLLSGSNVLLSIFALSFQIPQFNSLISEDHDGKYPGKWFIWVAATFQLLCILLIVRWAFK